MSTFKSPLFTHIKQESAFAFIIRGKTGLMLVYIEERVEKLDAKEIYFVWI